jgi:FeS assembly SUF system protein
MNLKDKVVLALRKVYDPELPVNIYDMGLIYDVTETAPGSFAIRMTLTAPNCPVAGSLPLNVERAVRAVEGVTDAKVELTFDPPWTPERMSEAAQLALGLDTILPIARFRG